MSQEPFTTAIVGTHLVREPGVPVRSVAEVTGRSGEFDEVTFRAVLVNADLRAEAGRARGALTVLHSFACDDEDDTARLAVLELADVALVWAGNGQLNFTAWMTGAPRFYPADMPVDLNPFLAAQKLVAENDEFANGGYPYQPPPISGRGITWPMRVEIRLDVTAGEHTEQWLAQFTPSL